MGDGIRKLLTILTSIYEVKDGVILIDEIENGMHFSTMKTLWKTIIHASMQFKVQVFVTTHNIEILKSLKEVVKEDMPEFADNLRHYTIQRMQNGVLKPYIYDFDKFDYALSQDLEIRS
jgi:AAA15 family ATPase/GTPase